MRHIGILILIAMLAVLAACASGASQQPMSASQIATARAIDEYTPPAMNPPQAKQMKIVVNKSVNQVCKAIEAYAQSPQSAPFVITHNIYKVNNQKPATATIMLNIAEPETCLDCGVNRFAYYQGEQLVKEWNYQVAVKEMVLSFDEKDSLSRFMSLVGQANLSVAPKGNGRTEISINIDYVLERKITAYTIRQLGGEKVTMPVTGISVAKFNSSGQGTMDDSVICISKGSLEQQILDGIKANLM